MSRAGVVVAHQLQRAIEGKKSKPRNRANQDTQLVKEARIRKRGSYQMWDRLANSINKATCIEDVLGHVYGVMDDMHAFGTEQQARWSKESLDLLIKDKSGS